MALIKYAYFYFYYFLFILGFKMKATFHSQYRQSKVISLEITLALIWNDY